MSMSEQDQYGTIQTAEPIPVSTHSPFVASTPNATASPDPQVMQAYYATIRRDLHAQRQQHGGSQAAG